MGGSSWLMNVERLCLSSFLGHCSCASQSPAPLGHHLSSPPSYHLGVFCGWEFSGFSMAEVSQALLVRRGGWVPQRCNMGQPATFPPPPRFLCDFQAVLGAANTAAGGERAHFLQSPSPPGAAVSAPTCPQQHPVSVDWMLSPSQLGYHQVSWSWAGLPASGVTCRTSLVSSPGGPMQLLLVVLPLGWSKPGFGHVPGETP